MESQPSDTHVLRFGVFELDADSGELRRHGLKIRLPDQSFQILKALLNRPGDVVSRDELRQVLWTTDTFVDFEVGLNSAVRKLREALDESADSPRFVETLPRRGYRFVGAVTARPRTPTTPVEPAREHGDATSRDPRPTPTGGLPAEAGPAPDTESVSAPSAVRSRHLVSDTLAAATRLLGAVSRRAIGLALVAVVVAAGVAYQRGAQADPRAGSAADPIRSVVVLPFETLAGDTGQEAFADDVTDAVTSHLVQVAGFEVISRTSARRYKQTGKQLPEIGRELNVDGVVEGAVVRSGDRVRITTKLIRAATDRLVSDQVYDDDIGHMLALQRQIASDIALAAGLRAPATGGGRTAQAVNAKAYDAYLKGITAQRLQRVDGIRSAVAHYDEAIAIQPDFGEAHAALALAQVQFLNGGPLSPRETIPKAEAAARRALQLDDTLGRAHWALGVILNSYYWQFDEGHKELQRAAVLQGDDELSMALSESLLRHGDVAEALALAERGRRLDPLSFNAQVSLGAAYRAAKQYDRAVTEGRRAIEMNSVNLRSRFQLGVTFVAMGRLDDAIRELEPAARPAQGHNSRIEAYLGYVYAAAGRTDDARAVLQELQSHRRDQYVSSFGIALIHDALGHKEPALLALEQAYDDRAIEFARLPQYPPFTTIASEPRFLAVMRQVGLPDQGR